MSTSNELIQSYLNGELGPEELTQFKADLKHDPALLNAWVRACFIDHELRVHFQGSDDENWMGIDPEASGAAEALAELARLHEEGMSAPLDFEAHRAAVRQEAINDEQRFKAHAKLLIAGGLAAVVVLGLFIALLVGSLATPTPQIIAQPDPPEPAREPIVVATLTDQRDARWTSGNRPVRFEKGASLTSGQRLKLTQGFAELTTLRGGIAMLQAPCEVELIDNPNALRLHSGMLVGRVEDESAQGFLIRTPHMDVTDLGTAFGIDASDRDATEVHVLSGSVQAVQADEQDGRGDSLLLLAGYAARSEAGQSDLIDVEHDPYRFSTITPITIQLPGSAAGRITGESLEDWRIVAINGRPLERAVWMATGGRPTGERADVFAPSRWVLWLPPEAYSKADTTYRVQTTFELPEELDPERVYIEGQFMVDNEILSIRVNGQSVDVPEQSGKRDGRIYKFQIDGPLQPGMNHVEFDISNSAYENASVNYVGLVVAWKLHTKTE